MSNAEEKDQGLLYVVVAGLVGLGVLGVVYWRFRTANQIGTLADHANIGNAMAPAVAFLTLLAVVAALWSVQIQRTELALQRKELQETREEMKEQRKQFELTASAQQRLADSQERLADAQTEANAIALNATLAQHRSVVANLAIADIQIGAQLAAVRAQNHPIGDSFQRQMDPALKALHKMRKQHEKIIATLAKAGEEDGADA